jgi:hypothetical protein
LAPWEQSALAQCSLFRGGFSAEAFEAVVDVSRFPDAPASLDVRSLCHTSLLVARECAALPGEARFELVPSVLDHVLAHMTEVEEGALAMRYARYFAALVREHAGTVEGPDGPRVLRTFAVEHQNFLHVAELCARARETPTFVVHPEGAWFEASPGRRVDLTSRPVMRRILSALIRARLDDRRRPLRWVELTAAAWPGDRIIDAAARNRVRVMVSRLRELGMRRVLRSDAEGYWLDAQLHVR